MIDASIHAVPYIVVGNGNIVWVHTFSDLKQHYRKLKEHCDMGGMRRRISEKKLKTSLFLDQDIHEVKVSQSFCSTWYIVQVFVLK